MSLVPVESFRHDGAASDHPAPAVTPRAPREALPAAKAESGIIDYVYILSASHSGSTLLTLLLASHSEVASVGETSAVRAVGTGDTGLCSCAAPVGECRFWREVRRRLMERGIEWNRHDFRAEFRLFDGSFTDRVLRAEYRGPWLEAVRDSILACSPAWRTHAPSIFRSNAALVEIVTELRGARVFVDSSKEPHRLKFMMRIPRFHSKVIHLIRDGRGVTASYLRKNPGSIEKAVDEWRRSVIAEEHILKCFDPADVTRLRYEDLCRNPAEQVAKLFAFMGVDPRHQTDGYQTGDHHILGNRMRMQAGGEIRLDERWRTALTEADLRTFAAMAGAINRRYGYE